MNSKNLSKKGYQIKEYNQSVADNVIRLISEKGLKQKGVAEKEGYTEQMLSDMLNSRKIVRIIDAVKLRGALEVTTRDNHTAASFSIE
jgi:hypothetical protein